MKNRNHKWRKYGARVIALCLICAMVALCGCQSKTVQQAEKAQKDAAAQKDNSATILSEKGNAIDTLSVCVGSEPETLDPTLIETAQDATVVNHLFEGLMKYDEKNKLVGGQAASYTKSDDGLTYTFTLRDGIKWSDGKAVKAQDFVYSWQRLVDPNTASPYSTLIDMVKGSKDIQADDPAAVTQDVLDTLGIKALDDKTIQVSLTEPCPYFLQVCAMGQVAPLRKDVIDKYGENWAGSGESYICNGPYTLKSWKHQAQVSVVKSDIYYNKGAIGPKTINFLLMDDPNTMLAAFVNGSIDYALNLPSEEYEGMKGKGLIVTPEIANWYVVLNLKKKPLDDVRVRKALALALNRDYIANVIKQGTVSPANTFVPKATSDGSGGVFDNGSSTFFDLTTYQANVAEAKKLLAEAGYPDGKGFPTLEFSSNSGHEAVLQAIQTMWRDNLGIKVDLTVEDFNVFVTNRNKGKFDIARGAWAGDYDDPTTFLDLATIPNSNNYGKYENTTYDSLVTQAKSTTDGAARTALLHQAESLLAKDMPVIPVYNSSQASLVNPDLRGYYISVEDLKYFMYATKK